MIELPAHLAARHAVQRRRATALEKFVAKHQPDDVRAANRWRALLTEVLAEYSPQPWWGHWTEVFGRPSNWRELAPETQRSWVEMRYQQAVSHDPVHRPLLTLARNEALASVGQSLPD